MSVHPVNFLDSAKTVFDTDKNETSLRTCISRAYYCMYHSAASLVPKGNIPAYDGKQSKRVPGGVHAKLIHYLATDAGEVEGLPQRDLIAISIRLKMSKALRTKADYKLDLSITSEHARDILYEAEKFLLMTEKIIKSKNNSGI